MVIVVLALIEHDDRVLLIQEAKEPVRGKWNLPGGRVEPSESLIDALVREVREEAGIEVTPQALLHVGQVVADATDDGLLRFVFRATAHTTTVKRDEDEHSLCAQWFKRSDVHALNLRSSHVRRMVELAASGAAALPISSVQSRARTGKL
jgi:8-oxo-dGTP diphosphatase